MNQEQRYLRLAHILARLKTGENMGIPELQKSLQSLEKTEGIRLECGIATIQRDVRDLKAMGCPIVYHRSKACQSYELKDKTWELRSEPLLGGDEMTAVVLGAQCAEALLPREAAARVCNAANGIFKVNTPSFLAGVNMASLRLLMPPLPRETEAVFALLFDAWKRRRLASIKYRDEDGGDTERVIEPQALLLHRMTWFVRAFCHLRNAPRTFAVTRVTSVAVLDRTFNDRPELFNDLDFDTFDGREQYRDVSIGLNAAGRQYALTHILHSGQKFKSEGEGRFTMTLPGAAKHLVVEWILAQRGNATPLAPAELVEDVRQACRRIMESIGNTEEQK